MRKPPPSAEYKVQYQNYQLIFAADDPDDLKVVDKLIAKMNGATISDSAQPTQGNHIYFFLYFVGERYGLIDTRMAELAQKHGKECLILMPISLIPSFHKNFPVPSYKSHGVYSSEFWHVPPDTLWQYSVDGKGLGKFVDADIPKAINFIDGVLSKITELEKGRGLSKGSAESTASQSDSLFDKIQNFFSGPKKSNDTSKKEAQLVTKEKELDFVQRCSVNEDYALLESFAKAMKQNDYVSARAMIDSSLKTENRK